MSGWTTDKEVARIGHVGSPGDVIDVTLVVEASQLADGDVMVVPQEITNAVGLKGGRCILQSIQLLDQDDQGTALDLIFFNAATTLGTLNSGPSITDTAALNIVGRVNIATTDYIDLGGCRLATKSGIGQVMKAAATTDSLWIGAISRGGTPTYTAAGIKLKLGMLWD